MLICCTLVDSLFKFNGVFWLVLRPLCSQSITKWNFTVISTFYHPGSVIFLLSQRINVVNRLKLSNNTLWIISQDKKYSKISIKLDYSWMLKTGIVNPTQQLTHCLSDVIYYFIYINRWRCTMNTKWKTIYNILYIYFVPFLV